MVGLDEPNTTMDHLRVCGADGLFWGDYDNMRGSPPRVRSRPRRPGHLATRPRITSACAEQTPAGPPPDRRVRDHLRVCGADQSKACLNVA